MEKTDFNIDDIFIDWTRYNQLKSEKYIISFLEFKYINTDDIEDVELSVSGNVKEGDVLIKSISGEWIFFTKEQFEKSFYNII